MLSDCAGEDYSWPYGSTLCLDFVFLTTQLAIILFLVYHLCYQHAVIAVRLKIAVIVYHGCLFMSILTWFADYLLYSSTLQNVTTFQCMLGISQLGWNTTYYCTMILFWHSRLKIVFSNTVFEISTPFNLLVQILAIFTMIAGIAGMVVVYLDKFYFNSIDNACTLNYNSVRVFDFNPQNWFVTSTNNHAYDTENDPHRAKDVLYRCTWVTNSKGIYYQILSYSGFVIVILNLLLFVQYSRKLYKITKMQQSEIDDWYKQEKQKRQEKIPTKLKQTSVNVSSDSEESMSFPKMRKISSAMDNVATNVKSVTEKYKTVYQSSILAIISVASTLIAISVFNSLVLLCDGIINGLALIAVFEFGNGVFKIITCHFCFSNVCKCT